MKKRRLDDLPPFERHPPSHEDEENRGEGDDAQATRLDQEHGDHLADGGEIFPRINNDETRHAYGRSGGEESIYKSKRILGSRNRETEEDSTCENDSRKTEDENPRRREVPRKERFNLNTDFHWL